MACAQALGQPLAREPQRLLQLGGPQQQLGELGGEVGLLAALLCLAATHARDVGDHAGEDRDGDEDHERDPLAFVCEVEAAARRQVEEVERRGAQQARGDPEAQSPQRGDEDHRGDVEHPQRRDRGDLLQRVDQRCGGGDAADGRHHAERPRRAVALQGQPR